MKPEFGIRNSEFRSNIRHPTSDIHHRSRRRGFTLVELLAVLVIIGILMGLITAAVIGARARARVAVMTAELKGLDEALNRYREQFGEYPPDFTDQTAVVRHFQRAFPRCTTVTSWNTLRSAVTGGWGSSYNLNSINPATALVFWLGGKPGTSGTKLAGFSANPANPFDNSGSRIGPFFEFDPTRLVTSSNWYYYRPDTGSSVGATSPYIYFRARSGNTYDINTQRYPTSSDLKEDDRKQGSVSVRVRPYYNSKTSGWYSPKSFQIICAGLDGQYGGTTDGAAPQFPSCSNFLGDGHYDNLTNFLNGTLNDNMR